MEAMADAAFHVVMRGNCWLEVEGIDEQIPLVGGDLVVLPTGVAHALRDHPDSSTVTLRELLSHRPCRGQLTLSYGGGGTSTTVVCGKANFENREINPLLSALPPLLLIKGEEGRAVEWLDSILQFIACETASNRPGAEMMITYLSNVLFIQAVRAHLSSLKQNDESWLRGLVDPQLNIALALIHHQPETNWTVESLAKQVNMSRSGFAARFKWLMREAPLQYVTRWRMYRAAELLRSSNLTVAEVAEQVGYGSETAFSKAFKRQMGQPPNQYRQQSGCVAKTL